MIQPDKNNKGNFIMYDKGNPVGEAALDYIDGVPVVASVKPIIVDMQRAAARDGVMITLAAGFRPWSKQLEMRKRHVIDKSKANDIAHLVNAPAGEFKPLTARPGWSNHQDGMAYDFNVTGRPKVYRWLVDNAIKFGFVRTVPSERWHWEYRPKAKQFDFVKQTDPSWQ